MSVVGLCDLVGRDLLLGDIARLLESLDRKMFRNLENKIRQEGT